MVERLAVLDRPANMLVDRAQVQRVLLREVRRVFVHARAWPKDCRTVARLEAKKQQGVVLMPNAGAVPRRGSDVGTSPLLGGNGGER